MKVLLHTGHQWTPQAKALCDWWSWAEFTGFFHGTPFPFQEMHDRQTRIIYTWACGIFHTKWMMWTWVLHGKEMTKFVTNNKAKIKILSYIYHCELDSFTILSPEEIDDNINVYGFWNCIMKCINIWKTGITQWTSVFPNNQCMMLEHHTEDRRFIQNTTQRNGL